MVPNNSIHFQIPPSFSWPNKIYNQKNKQNSPANPNPASSSLQSTRENPSRRILRKSTEEKMEEKKSVRKPSKRKPLTDLSNNIQSTLPSSQSPSSLIKPRTRSSLSLPIKSLLDNPNSNLRSNSKFTATEPTTNDNVKNDKKRKEKEKSQSNKTNPSSVLSPPPKTPSVSGVGDCVDSEPWTVYSRRHTAEKRKSKGKEIAEPLSWSLETRIADLRKRKSQSNKANPSSVLSSPPKTPSVSGVGDCVDSEPCTVYSRRHIAEKSKSKGKEIAEPLSWSLETRIADLRKRKSQSNAANPSSVLSSLPKTPSVSGAGDCVDFEPLTVCSRRHTAEKRKSKGKEIAEPLSCSLETRIADLRKRKDRCGDIGLSKSCPMPCKKKQRQEKDQVNVSKHGLPQDFINKQREYFAWIDSCELEEEVASADDLE